MSHKIKMVFSAGQVNGCRMGLTITINGNRVFDCAEVESDSFDIECTASMPLCIVFTVFGKDINDTQIDKQGTIVVDKFLRLDALCLDNIWVKKWMLENKLVTFIDQFDQRLITNYFGSNGIGTFATSRPDILEFWLDTMLVNEPF